uniref:Uncharacterized protein n=1 Tax=Rhizophora mucronata TaxID=61149 RepID=A0A2P2PYA5_RHIMU
MSLTCKLCLQISAHYNLLYFLTGHMC